MAIGASGPDVGWLHEFLASRDFQRVPEGMTATATTIELVAEFAADLGVSGDVTAFDPAWVVWLPHSPYEIATLELSPGMPAPGEGSAIATTWATLTAVDYEPIEGAPIEFGVGAAYVLTLGEVEVPLDANGDLTPGGLTELGLDLAESATEEAQGTVRRAEPRVVWSVPSAAIGTGPSGHLCIWVERGPAYEALPVAAISSQAGVTYLEPGSEPVMVLTNPADVLTSTSCPSS